jgi:hypothetical protein
MIWQQGRGEKFNFAKVASLVEVWATASTARAAVDAHVRDMEEIFTKLVPEMDKEEASKVVEKLK